MNKALKCALAGLSVALVSGCVTQPQRKDYGSYRAEHPRSILVVPAVNKAVNVDAPDYFLSTISVPLAERGYYVFPVHLVKRLLEDDGLSDADLVHSNGPEQLGNMFGTDAVLYVSIERWDAQYAVFSTAVTVELSYRLKSVATGKTLWDNKQTVVYQPQNNSGGGLAGLIAQAIIAAMTKAAPDYIPLAQQANAMAIYTKGQGLPAGPYDLQFKKDQADY